jgi:7-carboxy-7-deazaguanine synthase
MKQKMSEPMLAVAEMFVSIQGEGPSIGKPSLFLRLQGCNLKCSFCDTANTQGYKKETFRTLGEVREEIERLVLGNDFYVSNLVITGGEPGVQADALEVLFSDKRWAKRISQAIHSIDIETNGLAVKPKRWKFIADAGFPMTLCLSPKIEEYGNRYKTLNYSNLGFTKVAFKLIVTDILYGDAPKLLGNLHQMMDTFKYFDKSNIYLQPVDAKVGIAQWLAENRNFGCRLSLQIHKIIGVE